VSEIPTTIRGTPATATIAELYARQGKLDQARAILQRLAHERPTDEHVRKRLEQIEQRIAAELRDGNGADEDRAELRLVNDELECYWTISERGIRRARLLAGEDACLTLRRVDFPTRAKSRPRDLPLTQTTGSVLMPTPPGALVAIIAVGLVDTDGRFVAIAHSDHVVISSGPM